MLKLISIAFSKPLGLQCPAPSPAPAFGRVATAGLLVVCAALAHVPSTALAAADVEAFEAASVKSGRPNVLFVLDSTASLGSTVSRPSFDPAKAGEYAEFVRSKGVTACDSRYAYFRADGTKPDWGFDSKGEIKDNPCETSTKKGRLLVSQLQCDSSSMTDLATVGAIEAQKYVERIVKTSGKTPTTTYQPLKPSPSESNTVYCESYVGTDAPPPADFTGSDMTLWSGDYLNYELWVREATTTDSTVSRMDKVKEALEFIARRYDDQINMGMMRTATQGSVGDGAGKGGPVIFEVSPGDGPAKFSKYYPEEFDIAGASPTRLDDFIWTLYERVACSTDAPGEEHCGGTKTVADCPIGVTSPTCMQVMEPRGGQKPMTESLYEATLYFRGDTVDFGSNAKFASSITFNSVRGSIDDPATSGDEFAACPGERCKYHSPIEDACQRNYVILLTDGLSEGDVSRDSAITGLLESLDPDVREKGGYSRTGSIPTTACDLTGTNWKELGLGAGAPSSCADDLAYYLRYQLNVETFTVGFQLSGTDKEAAATQFLNDIALAGGTEKVRIAEDPEGLNLLIDGIVKKILTSNTSFSAPSVTINAFNRTQNLDDLYMAVFATEFKRKWEGNVKKYKIRSTDGEILDWIDQSAIDADKGFFKEDSQSVWYKAADGKLAPLGGAAALLPDPDGDPPRKIYTESGKSLLALRTFAATDDGAATFEVPAGEVSTLVDWLYGQDTYDEFPPRIDDEGRRIDGNGVTDETKRLMGDPLHSRPAVVVYGGPDEKGTPDPKDAVVYITTNEGLLHAIDARTGVEKWAFAPQELLYRLDFLRNFSEEKPLAERTSPLYYGLDGTVRVLRIDRQNDGPITSGAVADGKDDRVFIYFGMRRGEAGATTAGDGGRGFYYALDVTNPDSPKFMWKWALPDGAQSWSNPVVGSDIRSNIDGGDYGEYTAGYATFDNGLQNNRFVAIIGGGFDPAYNAKGDADKGTTFPGATKGNRIYMLDAADGTVLWTAGQTGASLPSDRSLSLDRMRYSIVSDIRALDLSVDGFIDRMYAADLGGQVWRFDVVDGSKATDLVMGGVMASVGGAEDPTKDRRFYYAPDISEMRCGGQVFYNIAIGSGDRENPVSDKTADGDTAIQNTFFSFRDYFLRARVPTANYKSTCPEPAEGEIPEPCFETIHESDLVDVTSPSDMATYPPVGAGSAGWKLDLVQSAVDGEKALAESRTYAGKIYFTTYSPEKHPKGAGGSLPGGDVCGDKVGTNRLYVVNACDARPITNYYGSPTDPALTIEDRSKILSQGSIAPEVVFVFPPPPAGCKTRDCMPLPVCLVGLETCGRGAESRPVRTFWRERGAE
jgi:type IV pilus assembly protein PilY1